METAEIESVVLAKCDIEDVDPFASDTESFTSENYDKMEQEEQEHYLIEENNTEDNVEGTDDTGYANTTECANTTEDNNQYNAIQVHVPFVCKSWIELNLMKDSFTKGELFEALKEKLPATFDSKGNFNGNLYTIEDGQFVFVDLDVDTDVVEGKNILFIHKLETTACDMEVDVEIKGEKMAELTTTTRNENRSKSLMRRFKNLWIKNASSTSASTSTSKGASSTSSDTDSNNVFAKDLAVFPEFFKEALEYLRRDEQIQEGLFRLSGTFTRIQSLKERLDAGEKLSQMNLTANDCHNVTSLLKQFFRNLPQPLLTFELYDAWQTLGTWTVSRKVAIKIARFLIEMLPEVNRMILRDLAKFLNDRLKDSEVTRMNACNYGTVIGPNLLWHPEEDRQTRDSNTLGLSLQSTTLASQIFTLMMQYHDEIFMAGGFEEGDVIGYGRVLYDYTGEDCEDCEINSDGSKSVNIICDSVNIMCERVNIMCESDSNEFEKFDCSTSCTDLCDYMSTCSSDTTDDISDINCDTTNDTTIKSDTKPNPPSFTETELIFITGIEDSPDGWWLGYLHPTSTPTKFPSNYLKIMGQSADKRFMEAVLKNK